MMTDPDVTMTSGSLERGFEMFSTSQNLSPKCGETPLNQSGVFPQDVDSKDEKDKNTERAESYPYTVEEAQSLSGVLQGTIPEIKLSFEKWGETFKECENVENLYPTRLDEIIKDAKSLEEQLNLQKEALKDRLRFLTRTLASVQSEEK